MVDGERRLADSVEELITAGVRPAVAFDAARFSAAGREDVDVRMLGRGRPFVLELVNPRKTRLTETELASMQTAINGDRPGVVVVRDLQIVAKADVAQLKDGEDSKRKAYTALCVTRTPYDLAHVRKRLESMKELVLDQRTPIRVLHRRPNALRRRTVHDMAVRAVDQRTFLLRLSTQAGTYVKEFVHGDLGRTTPNVRSLLAAAAGPSADDGHTAENQSAHGRAAAVDIAALDVEDIYLDWPPTKSRPCDLTAQLVENWQLDGNGGGGTTTVDGNGGGGATTPDNNRSGCCDQGKVEPII